MVEYTGDLNEYQINVQNHGAQEEEEKFDDDQESDEDEHQR
jgi:hypothetical protein